MAGKGRKGKGARSASKKPARPKARGTESPAAAPVSESERGAQVLEEQEKQEPERRPELEKAKEKEEPERQLLEEAKEKKGPGLRPEPEETEEKEKPEQAPGRMEGEEPEKVKAGPPAAVSEPEGGEEEPLEESIEEEAEETAPPPQSMRPERVVQPVVEYHPKGVPEAPPRYQSRQAPIRTAPQRYRPEPSERPVRRPQPRQEYRPQPQGYQPGGEPRYRPKQPERERAPQPPRPSQGRPRIPPLPPPAAPAEASRPMPRRAPPPESRYPEYVPPGERYGGRRAPRAAVLQAPPRPRRRLFRKEKIGVIAVVIVLILLLALIFPQVKNIGNMMNPSDLKEYPEAVEFTMQRSIEMVNVQSYTIDVPIPEDIPNAQTVVSVTSNTNYYPMTKYGKDWMNWSDDGNADVTITYSMKTRSIVWNINSEDVLTVKEANASDSTFREMESRYNHIEWKIDPTLREITQLADQLNTGGTIYDQIKSIYDYLVENFQYKTGGRNIDVKSPSETLSDRNGDCDDMSFLFNALSRAMGIPSWVELGQLYDPTKKEWVGHAWVELYLPTKDPGKSGLVNIDIVNKEFLVRAANRFSDWTSDGSYTDNNGNGKPDCDASDCEWNIYDYYYMYIYLALSSGVTVQFSDVSTAISYDAKGSVKTSPGGQPWRPTNEFLIQLIALVVALIICIFLVSLQKRSDRRRR